MVGVEDTGSGQRYPGNAAAAAAAAAAQDYGRRR
jgi:hypothetical protein